MEYSLENAEGVAGSRDDIESTAFLSPEKAVLPNKKRGRPKKEETESEPVQWTIPMIEALLQQRDELKDEFLDSKDKVALARGWSKIVLHLQSKFQIVVNPGQVKSKYQQLQKTYRTHKAADKQTGNAPIPKKPIYWEVLVCHFGCRNGLGHDCLFSSEPLELSPVFHFLQDSGFRKFLIHHYRARRIVMMPFLFMIYNRHFLLQLPNQNAITVQMRRCPLTMLLDLEFSKDWNSLGDRWQDPSQPPYQTI